MAEETKVADSAPPFIDNLEREAKFKVILTDTEKEEFFKAFLAEKPYQEDMSLFGDKFHIRFSTLNVAQNNDIFNQIVLDQEKGVAKNHDSYFIQMSLFRLGLSLIETNHKPFNIDITPVNTPSLDGVSYVRVKAEAFKLWPVYKLSAILEAFKTFENKVNELTKSTQDPAFWKAAV